MADRIATRRGLEAFLICADLPEEGAAAMDGDPVLIGSPGRPSRQERERVLTDYQSRGYAWFELDVTPQDAAQALVGFTSAFSLGPPFVPPLYNAPGTAGLYDSLGVNVVTAATSQPSSLSHPTFESRAALELHTDGTLQTMGEIPAAVLFCVTPAGRGGETTIFHGIGAFLHLAREHPDLACTLLDGRALTRHATVNGSTATCTGPVFEVCGGEILSRFSTTPRDQWAFEEVDRLREAYQALLELVRPPYLTQIRLEAGQGVLLANDKVSHGRTAFEDGFVGTRRMLRALFQQRPR